MKPFPLTQEGLGLAGGITQGGTFSRQTAWRDSYGGGLHRVGGSLYLAVVMKNCFTVLIGDEFHLTLLRISPERLPPLVPGWLAPLPTDVNSIISPSPQVNY